MNRQFLKAVEDTLRHEGGYNDIKEDAGGATNYGVSLRFLQTTRKDINRDGKVDWLDIRSLTREQAIEIYYDNFWRPVYDKLPPRLAAKVFDTAVNAGHTRAHILLQQSLNSLSISAGSGSNLRVDGMVGQVTLGEVAKYPETELLKAYSAAQLNFYHSLVAARPSQKKFIRGWANRANWLPA